MVVVGVFFFEDIWCWWSWWCLFFNYPQKMFIIFVRFIHSFVHSSFIHSWLRFLLLFFCFFPYFTFYYLWLLIEVNCTHSTLFFPCPTTIFIIIIIIINIIVLEFFSFFDYNTIRPFFWQSIQIHLSIFYLDKKK